ncbi:S16 family serine protease [Planococcus halotolerans]|uniref:Lon proteolytic domain-containing protein n=1 Tax=Planococcus halotolerans TaxID=2233542 RepID=A0A365L790_9BACL|nr:S16 family serine protease [Planococcus halotolerans]RAZ81278.1 hypothetical protein DP120_03045 [Planococcus halotolerans]
MKEKKRGSRFLLIISVFIIFYIILSSSFYFGFINAYIVAGVLFLTLMISWGFLFRYRHIKGKFGKVSLIVLLVGILFIFDFFLLQFEQMKYRTLIHEEPVQAAGNSGIHLMSVGTAYFSHAESKEWLIKNFERGGQDFFQMEEVDNKTRYHSRNDIFLQLVGIRNDEVSVMAKNVRSYLGEETAGVEQFLESEDISGDSAGLGLALTGLIEQNKLMNNLDFGVTGALSEQGEVSGIGMIKEKLTIAEKQGYPFMIIPSENAQEARRVKEVESLEIQLVAVSHIDEAVRLINRLNAEAEE